MYPDAGSHQVEVSAAIRLTTGTRNAIVTRVADVPVLVPRTVSSYRRRVSVATAFVSILSTLSTTSTMASVIEGEQPSKRLPLIVHDLVRSLFVPEGTWLDLVTTLFVPKGTSPEHISLAFGIEPTSDMPLEVWITARGLGAVRFAEMKSDQDVICPMDDGLSVLKVQVPPKESLRVGACIPTEHLPFPGHMQDGHLLLLSADYGSMEVPLTLTRYAKPTSNLVAGVQWFLGFFIPTALTAGIGFLIWKRQQWFTRQDEQKHDFEEFKLEKSSEIADYFEENYRVLRKLSDAEFARLLLEDFNFRNWLAPIPRKERSRFLDALREKKTDRIVKELAAVFWENEESIRR